MDDRMLGRSIGIGRVLFGALCLIVPRRILGANGADAPGPVVWMIRAFGVRDAVLGAGAITSLSATEPDPSWVTFGAIADTADVATALMFRRDLGPATLAATLALAVPAAVGGWKASIGLRSRSN